MLFPVATAQQTPDLCATLVSLESRVLVPGRSSQPYHLHYDLVAPVQHGSIEYGSYDRYQSNTSAASLVRSLGDFQEISTLTAAGTPVATRSGPPPLALLEFGLAVPIPSQTLFGRVSDWRSGKIHHQQPTQRCFVSYGERFFCRNEQTGLPTSLSLGGTQISYAEWTNFSGRFAPLHITISYRGRVLLEATGHIEPVKDFQPPPQSGKSSLRPSLEGCGTRHVLQGWRVSNLYGPTSGFVQLGITIDPKGRVKSAKVLGSDDRKLEASALDGTRSLQYDSNPAQSGLCTATTLYRGTLDRRDLPTQSESSLTELLNPNR